MISTGTYRAKAIRPIQWSESPEKHTPGAVVRIKILEGPEGTKDQSIDWVGWLSDKTVERTQESLATMGYDGDDDASVMRNEFEVVIEHETFTRTNGEQDTRPRAAWINKPGGAGRFDAMGPAEIAGAKARLKAAALAAKNKSGAPPTGDPADDPKW